jgi:hypothetical protein
VELGEADGRQRACRAAAQFPVPAARERRPHPTEAAPNDLLQFGARREIIVPEPDGARAGWGRIVRARRGLDPLEPAAFT